MHGRWSLRLPDEPLEAAGHLLAGAGGDELACAQPSAALRAGSAPSASCSSIEGRVANTRARCTGGALVAVRHLLRTPPVPRTPSRQQPADRIAEDPARGILTPPDARRYPWSAVRSERTMEGVSDTPSSGPTREVVRVLVVDDHPALRAGLARLLSAETGIEFLGTLAGTNGLSEAVRDARPDVVVLDYALGSGDGLTVCFRLKQQPRPPAVIPYSGYIC